MLVHCALWFLLPSIFRYALPHDTIEGALWGQHLQWGYDKNPWMNAWLTRLGIEIGGSSGIGIYFISSIFTGISFWSVWKLAEKMLPPMYAIAAVLLLEGCVNYTLVPQSFNDNLIELALWPLMFLTFYNALQNQKIRDWCLTGLVAGLAMMAKYYTGVPLAIMGIFLIITKEGRLSFKQSGLYIGLAAFLLVILPHIIWLFQNNFLTIQYAFNRAENTKPNFMSFTFSQITDFIFPIILILVFKFWGKQQGEIALNNFNRKFLLWMSLGPFLLTTFLAMIFKWHLYSEWGVPLVTLWGVLLISLIKPNFNERLFSIFIKIIYIIMFLWAIGYVAGLYVDHKRLHSDNYPAQEIANYVTEAWEKQYHTPLKYVAGSRYVGGYIAIYSKDHPSVFVEWTPEFSSGINLDQMKKYGAVFVQDNYYGTTVFGKHPDTHGGLNFPAEVLQRYPNLIVLPVKYFKWKRGDKNLPPIPVLIGFLPPA